MKKRIDIPEKIEEIKEKTEEFVEDIQEVSEDVQEFVEATEELTKELNSLWDSVKGFLINIVYGIKNGIVATIRFFKNLFKKKED